MCVALLFLFRIYAKRVTIFFYHRMLVWEVNLKTLKAAIKVKLVDYKTPFL